MNARRLVPLALSATVHVAAVIGLAAGLAAPALWPPTVIHLDLGDTLPAGAGRELGEPLRRARGSERPAGARGASAPGRSAVATPKMARPPVAAGGASSAAKAPAEVDPPRVPAPPVTASASILAPVESASSPTPSPAAPAPVVPDPGSPKDSPALAPRSEPTVAAAPGPPVATGKSGTRGSGDAESNPGSLRASAGESPGAAPGGEGDLTAARAGVGPGASGSGSGARPAEYGAYLRQLRERIHAGLEYPLAARRQGLAGTVELEVRVEPSGRLSGVAVVGSSGHALLDEAAAESVRRIAPPPLPAELRRAPLRVRVPVVFELR
ncbi:MAG: TonB family protein [Candidatus Rokubacteria bacterium]|nr:TonB family protein [Candidatus Rokubacteria bacterium]